MKAREIAEYLEYVEQADPAAARKAASQIIALHADRYFFHAWWLEAIAACVTASPALTDPPAAVLARLVGKLKVRISDVFLPHCPGCGRPLRHDDVQAATTTARCRACVAAAAVTAAVPEQRRREHHPEIVSSPATPRNSHVAVST